MQDPTQCEALARAATTVSLDDGGTRTVTLKTTQVAR